MFRHPSLLASGESTERINKPHLADVSDVGARSDVTALNINTNRKGTLK